MSAQGNQPQSGSGASEYDEWASSPQYGPEDWDDFDYMQDSNEYDENHLDEAIEVRILKISLKISKKLVISA